MATPIWLQTNTVISLSITNLMMKPQTFHFFQAVRLLKTTPYTLQFRTRREMCHAAGEIAKLDYRDELFTLWLTFMGLLGPQSIMPEHYHELALVCKERNDYSLLDFLDIFNHRTIALFYDVWQKSQFTFCYENNQPEQALDLLTALSGHSLNETFSQEFLIYYSGLLSQQVHSREAITSILQDYFGLPINLRPYQGRWVRLHQNQMTCLGRKAQFNSLGQDTLIGHRVWHLQNHFSVEIGPLDYQQFKQLLPNSLWLKTLGQFITSLVGREFQFTFKLILPRQVMPKLYLKQDSALALGWNTALFSCKNDLLTLSPAPIPFNVKRLRTLWRT